MEIKLCGCGCGEAIEPKAHHRYSGPPRFRVGHAIRLKGEGRPGRKSYVPTPEETPSGICECGCGQPTAIVRGKTERKARRFVGYPSPRLPGHGYQPPGDQHWNWKGGICRTSNGYVLEFHPDHAEANRDGYVRQHRWVVEQARGWPLAANEVVHHINGIKDDNRLENLVALTHAEHAAEHGPERKYNSEVMRTAGRKGAAVRWGKPLPPAE